MIFLAPLKNTLVRLLLRTWVFEWWLRRKVRKIEIAYACALVRSAANPPAPEGPPPRRNSQPLRRLLFISDIMWESRELVPEVAKITAVQTLDLNPHLKQSPPVAAAQIVARVVGDFVRAHSGPEPDAIFLYARSSLLSEEVFALLRRRWSCPLLGMNLDDKLEFANYGIFTGARDNYGHWARRFDLNLSNVRAVVDWYAERGLPVMYLPEGFHPKFTAPPASISEFQREVAFVGSRRTERAVFFRQLSRLGVRIEPFGFGWPNSASGKNPEVIYRTSAMNLGIGFAAPSQTLTTLKTRDFECPGAGACYLTTYNWELALHYELGKEILCYRSLEELVEMYSFYRKRPEACLQIAQAGFQRANAEHTWEQRFRKVFRAAGFDI